MLHKVPMLLAGVAVVAVAAEVAVLPVQAEAEVAAEVAVLPVQAEAEVAAVILLVVMVVVAAEKIVTAVRLTVDNAYRFKQLLFAPVPSAVEALLATPIFKVVQINAAANTIAVMLTRRLLYNQYKMW